MASPHHIMHDLSRVPNGPLYGKLIVVFGQQIAGPYAAAELAHAGATVIKVELPEGDPKRHNSPATAFNTFNAGTISIVIGKTPENLQQKLELLRHADVIIDNRSHAARKRDATLQAALREERKKPLIFCAISGFGPHDPSPAYDRVIQAKTGMADLNNGLIPFPVIDMTTGLEAAKSIGFYLSMINGLSREEQEKIGCIQLDVSMAAVSMKLMSNPIAIWLATGHKGTTLVPFDLFSTRDGRICIAIAKDHQYQTLCQLLQAEEICQYQTNQQRFEHRHEIGAALHRILAERTSEEWLELFHAHQIPAEPANSLEQAIAYYNREMIQPDIDGSLYIGGPTTSSHFPRNPSLSSAPQLRDSDQRLIQLNNGLRTVPLVEYLAIAENRRGNPQERFTFVNLGEIDFTQAESCLPWANSRVFEVKAAGRIRVVPIEPGEVFITSNLEKIRYRNVAKEGDVKILAETGDSYLISQDSLERNYGPPDANGWREAEPFHFKAVIATRDIRYNAPWGKTAYAPAGSVIIERNPHKIYAVSPRNFAVKYTITNVVDEEIVKGILRALPQQEKTQPSVVATASGQRVR